MSPVFFCPFRYFRRHCHIYLSERKVLAMFIPFVFRVVIHRKYTEILSLRWRLRCLFYAPMAFQNNIIHPLSYPKSTDYSSTLQLFTFPNFTSPLISLPYLLQPPHNLTSSYKDSSPSQFHCFCSLTSMLLYHNNIEIELQLQWDLNKNLISIFLITFIIITIIKTIHNDNIKIT